MNNLSIQFKNLGHNLLSAKKNLVVVFYLALIILIVFEAFVVKGAVTQVLASRKEQLPSRSVQKVRINFTDYDAAVKRIKSGQDFSPNLNPSKNPFKTR